MKLKDYLLLSLIFAAIAAVAVFFTVKVVKETTPALPEVVKVEEVNKAVPRSQSNLVCNVFDFDSATNCAVGSKIVFTPLRWGNDQLPIYFAGHFCDLNYAVVSNNGGVTCIKAAPYEEPQAQGNNQENNASQDEESKADKSSTQNNEQENAQTNQSINIKARSSDLAFELIR